MQRVKASLLPISLLLALSCCLAPWIAGSFATNHLGKLYIAWLMSVPACIAAKVKHARLSMLIGMLVALFPVLLIFIGGLMTGDWP